MFVSLISKKKKILLDHQVDQIEQSNQQLEYLNLLLQHLYIIKFQFQHYKIQKMFLFSFVVFVFPILLLLKFINFDDVFEKRRKIVLHVNLKLEGLYS